MRILHVFDHSLPLHSGYSFRSLAILRAQRELGYDTLHLTGAKQYGSTELEEMVDSYRFFRTPPGGGWSSRLPLLNQWDVVVGLKRRMREILALERVDILHAHSPCLNGLAALSIGRDHGLPVVYELRAVWEDAAVSHGTCTEDGLRYRLSRALETYVLRRADGVTTICDGLRKRIIGRGIPEQRITVIPNAVDLARFGVTDQRDEALADELHLAGHVVLGFLGSFYAYEGLDLLVSALPQILSDVPPAKLLLVGGGPEEEALRRRVRDLGLEDHVTFAGRVPHDRIQRYYGLVDICVYPRLSIRLTESVTPLKPLEAMAQGRLVLASDVGGHRELIRHGETGTLFRAGDPGDLARAVARLLADRSEWPRLRENGRRFVAEERNWNASVGRYRQAYSRVAGSRRGKSDCAELTEP